MVETIQLGDIAISVTRKDIKHVHLSVHPPAGRVWKWRRVSQSQIVPRI